MNDKLYVKIIIDISAKEINKPFLYAINKEAGIVYNVGEKVIIPFGKSNKETEGFIIEILTYDELVNSEYFKRDTYFNNIDSIKQVKYIITKAENKVNLSDILLNIAMFMSKEYLTPLSVCLNTVLPVKKIIRSNKRQIDVNKNYENISKESIVFNDEQQKVYDNLIESYNKKTFSEHFIFGVTGSGKTIIYIELIKQVLRDNKKVIVLIPEISLTYQTVIRLKNEFGNHVAIIHSKMSQGEKYIQYKKCLNNEVNILVGPRSAIFAPYDDLGLVVIDEVNDNAYHSDSMPRYNTLDVARFRCRFQKAMLVTLTATPTISYYYKSNNSNVNLHILSKRASSDVSLPSVYIVDMKTEYKNNNKSPFSLFLKNKINEKLKNNEQVMLYMNRRGYSRILTCISCGYTFTCPHCDISLTIHNDGKLKCHYCGYEENEPIACPICHETKLTKYGMGTQKLEELCQREFKNARILRMDRDTTLKKNGHDEIIKKFMRHEADILIGTQMIVKGHDFKDVTLVAVMCADMFLNIPNFTATEEAFSILTQCIGRSGRKKQGEAIIQVYNTENDVIKTVSNQNYIEFYNDEIVYRKKMLYPPFCILLVMNLSSSGESYLFEISKDIKLFLTSIIKDSDIFLGPARPNPSKIKDNYFMIFNIKTCDMETAKAYREALDNFIVKKDKLGRIKYYFDIIE